MLFIIVCWIVFFPIFCGFGLLIYAAFRQRQVTLENFFLRFWTGYAAVIAFLQIYHFFAPVNWIPLVLFVIAGAAGWLLNARQIIHWLRSLHWWQPVITLAVFAPISVWVANRCLRAPLTYDTPFYHWQNTIWNSKYPLVIGLANIHERFGFNSSHFLYTALIDVGPLVGKSMFFADGLLAVVLLLYVLTSASRLLSPQTKPQPHLFDGLLIPAVISWILGQFTGSYHPDWPVFAIGALASSTLIHWMFAEQDREKDNFRLFNLSLLVSTGIAIKLSFAALGGCTWLLGASLWVFRQGGLRLALQDKKPWLFSVGTFASILLVWMIRGVLLSGYPAFPMKIGGLPVPWKVPITRLYYQDALIRGFARKVGTHWAEAIYGWDWLPGWLSSSAATIKILASAGIILLIGLALSLICRKQKPWRWIFLIPGILATVAWFFAAPDARFSGATFWVLLAGAAALLYDEVKHILPEKRVFGYLPVLILFSFAYFYKPFPLKTAWFLPRWDLPAFDEYILKNRYTANLIDGVSVYVGDYSELCFNHPLPCTNHLNPGLHLREPGNIKMGFWVNPAEHKEIPPGMDGDLPLGADIAWVGSYEPVGKDYITGNYFHLLLYSDQKEKVKATMQFKNITRNDKPISSLDFRVRVNGIDGEVITVHPGQPVDIEIPLIEGTNEFTLKEDLSGKNSEPADDKDVNTLLDKITFTLE